MAWPDFFGEVRDRAVATIEKPIVDEELSNVLGNWSTHTCLHEGTPCRDVLFVRGLHLRQDVGQCLPLEELCVQAEARPLVVYRLADASPVKVIQGQRFRLRPPAVVQLDHAEGLQAVERKVLRRSSSLGLGGKELLRAVVDLCHIFGHCLDQCRMLVGKA